MGTLDKIVALLNENNKQQKDLMDFLGVSKSTFNKWKKGENKSYLKHVQKIAEFLGTTSAYLLGKTPFYFVSIHAPRQNGVRQIKPKLNFFLQG